MAVKNNYWKTKLRFTPRHYYAGPGGWEIHIRVEEQRQYGDWRENWGKLCNEKGYVIDKNGNEVIKKVIYFDIPRECPTEARKDFKLSLAMDKRIAQSVTTEEEYRNLNRRIDYEDWDYIIENNLKDEGLAYWAYNTRTSEEYYNLLRYN